MSNVMTVALQFTAIDLARGIVDRVRRNILSLGQASGQVKRDFDDMTRHVTTGLKAIAAASYAVSKIRTGVRASGDLQEAMINVRLNLMEAGKSAHDLNAELAAVRGTAVEVSKITPFGAQGVVDIQNVFLKAGLALKDVAGKSGAAYAASALATLSGEMPETIAEGMVTMATPFNIKGGQFGELADFIQRVDAASATTIPELQEGMKYLSGTAAAMKISWQDTLKLLGLVAQSGLRGSMGGTGIRSFLSGLTAGSRIVQRMLPQLNRELRGRGADPLEFWDKQGKLKTMPAIIANMRQALHKLSDKEKMRVLERLFGEQGGLAALALIKEGSGSWEEFGPAVGRAANITDKLEERLKGVNAQMARLAGATRTTLATLFDPLLVPLARVLSMLSDIIGKIGEVASEKPALAKAVSGTAAAGAAALGAYGLYKILKGGAAGARVLKGVGGWKGLFSGAGSTAAGIAKGKAVEAATGVTPVFVTNWPAGGIGGIAAGIPGGVPKGAGMAGKLATLARTGGALAFAGAAGYAIGSVINEGINAAMKSLTGGKNDSFGAWLYDAIHGTDNQPKVKNDIKIALHIDEARRLIADIGSLNNTEVRVDLDRGSFGY